jgi:16S rRNA pseudouridine516 synthase
VCPYAQFENGFQIHYRLKKGGTFVRLDKWLTHMGMGSRKEVRGLLKTGIVMVNDKPEKDPSRQVHPEKDLVMVHGEPLTYESFVYFLLNKPQGVITATEDAVHETVLDLLEERDRRKDLFPVGRLDKDTEGLLLITNDGALAHKLLSPKHHVEKTYEANINGPITEEIISAFEKGIELKGDGITKPARLMVLSNADTPRVEIKINEGKYHQIKRMFVAVGREVLYLKRTKMGPLELGPELALGAYRPLSLEERTALVNLKGS